MISVLFEILIDLRFLFCLTAIHCLFLPLLGSACGRSADWTTVMRADKKWQPIVVTSNNDPLFSSHSGIGLPRGLFTSVVPTKTLCAFLFSPCIRISLNTGEWQLQTRSTCTRELRTVLQSFGFYSDVDKNSSLFGCDTLSLGRYRCIGGYYCLQFNKAQDCFLSWLGYWWSKHLRNVGNCSPVDRPTYPRRLWPSGSVVLCLLS
jgi:hypothetical protein